MDQTLRPYNPTWRDQLAQWVLGDQRPTAGQRSFVSGLLGSAGIGSTGASVADMTPIGGLLSAQESAQRGDMKGAALAMLPMPAAKARGIIAYHGSPHSFDRFDLSKIGTGEGAQAYGHGLYFAEAEDTAKAYRDQLATDVKIGGRPILSQNKTFSATTGNPDLDDYVVGQIGDVNAIRKALLHDAQYVRSGNPQAAKEYQKMMADLRKVRGDITTGNSGSMYQVRINADPEHFLDWDKPLSQQSEPVRAALERTGVKQDRAALNAFDDALLAALEDRGPSTLPKQPPDPRGESIYRNMVGGVDAFRQAGIPGIKYLDQGSRGAGEGSRNYVVFDDKIVEILKKYGLVGLLGGGAALGASGQPQPEL